MELWDLYDAERVKTGETIQRGEKMPAGKYRLVVCVCIFDARGRMLIQRRQPFKRSWSGYWDLSVGGCAIAGDDSKRAAEREVREELGYPLDLTGERPALTIHIPDGFNDIYLIHRDLNIDDLTLQYEEVAEVKWATLPEIFQMIDGGTFIPYYKSILETLFYFKDRRDTRTRPDDSTPRT